MDVLDMEGCEGKEDCKLSFHQPGYRAGHPRFTDDGKKYCADLLMRLKGDLGDTIMITMGSKTPHLSEPNMALGTMSNGRPILATDKAPSGWSKIALVIDPANDYHFYRQDSNGMWSHKPGGQLVTDKDAYGNPIYNPERCSRDYRKPGVKDSEQLNYSVFCAYLFVRREGAIPVSRVQRQQGGSLSRVYSRMATRRTKTRKVGGVRGTPVRKPAAASARTASTSVKPYNKRRAATRNQALEAARAAGLTPHEKRTAIQLAFDALRKEDMRKKEEHNRVKRAAENAHPGDLKAQGAFIGGYYARKRIEAAADAAAAAADVDALAAMMGAANIGGPAAGAGGPAAGAGGPVPAANESMNALAARFTGM
jgi:hypothetical protein